MITRKTFALVGLALVSLIVHPGARASEIDQATRLTFSQSIQIPGRVLPAGTYWFVAPTPDVVQIYSSDRSTMYATLLTYSAERPHSADRSTVILADRGSMQPEAIVTWFYPGRAIGHEFLYSNQDQKEIAQANRHTVAAGD
jgi:hypothetical protein